MSLSFSSLKKPVLGAQTARVFVVALWVLIASLLFIDNLGILRFVILIALVIALMLGVLFLRTAKLQLRQREYLKRTLEHFEASSERMHESDKEKAETLSLTAKDLSRPLRHIEKYAAAVVTGEFGEAGEEAKGAVARILDLAQLQTERIALYMDLIEIERGTLSSTFVSIDLRALLTDIAKRMKPDMAKVGIGMTLTAPVGDYHIMGDIKQCRKVIIALIRDAMRNTSRGFIALSLSKNAKTGSVVVGIKDTGKGMDKETASQLFDKPVSVELSYAKEIMALHKGKLSAQSAGMGKGTQVYIEYETSVK